MYLYFPYYYATVRISLCWYVNCYTVCLKSHIPLPKIKKITRNAPTSDA